MDVLYVVLLNIYVTKNENPTAVLPSSPNHYLRQIGQGFVIKSYDLTYKQTDYNFIYIY